ncbi:MAG TPA: (2Fe-2S)-binding protein [Pilimelia sp.]|nr:(2Fe-2S)-binding protein [Pilimelia sp.]
MSVAAVSTGDVVRALDRVAGINALFGVDHEQRGAPGVGRWRSATELCRSDDPPVAELVGSVGEWLGTAERRVAASMVVLGYSARLVAPAVAVLLCDGILLDLRPDAVWWRYAAGEGFAVRLPAPAGWRSPAGFAALLDEWGRQVVDGHLRPVVGAVRRDVRVAEGLLWGNVASSLAGSLRMLALGGTVPLPACRAAGAVLLGYGPLRDAGVLTEFGGQLFFVRRSCCLYYRLPGGGLCGDCPLVDDTERERQWARALTSG